MTFQLVREFRYFDFEYKAVHSMEENITPITRRKYLWIEVAFLLTCWI